MGGVVSRQTAWNWFESSMVSFANTGKSFDLIAVEIRSIRCGTTCLIRCWRREEVATVRCIPAVEGVPFFLSDTTRIIACRSSHASTGATS